MQVELNRSGLWFVLGRLLALFEPEFKQSGLTFRLGNMLQRECPSQAVFIKRPLLRVGFLKRFPLQALPIRIGYSGMSTQEVDLDGLERKDFREHLDDRRISQKSWTLLSHDYSFGLGRGTHTCTAALSASSRSTQLRRGHN